MISTLDIMSHLPVIIAGIFLGLGAILFHVLEIKKKVDELAQKISRRD